MRSLGFDHFRHELLKRKEHKPLQKKKPTGRLTQVGEAPRSDRKLVPVSMTSQLSGYGPIPENEYSMILDQSSSQLNENVSSKKSKPTREAELMRFNVTKNFEQFRPEEPVKRNIGLKEYQSHKLTNRADYLSSAGDITANELDETPVVLLKMIDDINAKDVDLSILDTDIKETEKNSTE